MFPTYHFNQTALMVIYLLIALALPAIAIYFDNREWPHKH